MHQDKRIIPQWIIDKIMNNLNAIIFFVIAGVIFMFLLNVLIIEFGVVDGVVISNAALWARVLYNDIKKK